MFRYVFGGAIPMPGVDYVDFLMAGIIVQNIAFGGMVTWLGLSEDLNKGMIDRLPVAADGPLGGAGGPDAGRRRAETSCR